MRIALRALWIIFAFSFLTVVTQIGGLVYVITLILFIFIRHRFDRSLIKCSSAKEEFSQTIVLPDFAPFGQGSRS